MPSCRNYVLALSRDFEVNGTFRINRQARSWDHLTTILILLPTQSEMLPSGFFRSPRATGTHFGRGKRREKKKKVNTPKTSFFHLQVCGVSVEFNSVGNSYLFDLLICDVV